MRRSHEHSGADVRRYMRGWIGMAQIEGYEIKIHTV